jgi:hypothetical protein
MNLYSTEFRLDALERQNREWKAQEVQYSEHQKRGTDLQSQVAELEARLSVLERADRQEDACPHCGWAGTGDHVCRDGRLIEVDGTMIGPVLDVALPTPPERQVRKLNKYILAVARREMRLDEDMADTTIRLLKEYRAAFGHIMAELGVPGPGYAAPVSNAYTIARKAIYGKPSLSIR